MQSASRTERTTTRASWPGRMLLALALLLGVLPAFSASRAASAATAIPCTDQAIGDAVAEGGAYTFACGPNPVTIVVGARIVSKDVSFDGGGFVTLSGNNANRFFSVSSGVTLSLSNMTLRNGKYALSGGALNVLGTLNLTDVTLANNTAQQGAAIMGASSSVVTITRSTIADNTVTANGGGVYNNGGTLTVTNSVISGNAAGTGGGVYTSGNTLITGTTISGNRAATAGGIAVYPASGKTVTIANSTISGNTATGSSGGGGLYVFTTATLNNVTISDNTASGGSGGGMRTAGTSTLNGVTIAGNSAGNSGGGLYISGTAANVANTIIAGNTGGSPDCYATGTKFVSLGYNLVGDVTGCPVTGDPTGNLTGVDPLLGALAGNGGPVQTRALATGSPALNAGNPATAGGAIPACNATDARGMSRTSPSAGRCDIGAVEAQGSPPITRRPVVTLAKGVLGVGSSGKARVKVSWSATDADGIAGYELQQKANGGVWTAVALPSPTATRLTLALPTASSYVFRAHATDTGGATSAWVSAPVATLQLVQEGGTGVATTGAWTTETLAGASGGSVRWADAGGARATFTASSAKGLAWVTTKGPDRGKARVYIDGTLVTTVDLYAATYRTRQIVFAANRLSPGAHTIEIRVLGTKRAASFGTRVDIDAFMLMR